MLNPTPPQKGIHHTSRVSSQVRALHGRNLCMMSFPHDLSHLFHVKWKKRFKKQLPTRNAYSVISGVFFRGVELKVLSFSHAKIHSKDLWIVVFTDRPHLSVAQVAHAASESLPARDGKKNVKKGCCMQAMILGRTASFPTKAIFIMTMMIMMIMMNVPSSAYVPLSS